MSGGCRHGGHAGTPGVDDWHCDACIPVPKDIYIQSDATDDEIAASVLAAVKQQRLYGAATMRIFKQKKIEIGSTVCFINDRLAGKTGNGLGRFTVAAISTLGDVVWIVHVVGEERYERHAEIKYLELAK